MMLRDGRGWSRVGRLGGRSQLGTLQAPIPFPEISGVPGGDAIGVLEMFSVSPGHKGACPLARLELVTVPTCPEPPAPTQGWVHRGSLQIQGGVGASAGSSCFL